VADCFISPGSQGPPCLPRAPCHTHTFMVETNERCLGPVAHHGAFLTTLLLSLFASLVPAILCQPVRPAPGRRAPRSASQQCPPLRGPHTRLPGWTRLPDDDDPPAAAVLPKLPAGHRLLHTWTGRAVVGPHSQRCA